MDRPGDNFKPPQLGGPAIAHAEQVHEVDPAPVRLGDRAGPAGSEDVDLRRRIASTVTPLANSTRATDLPQLVG